MCHKLSLVVKQMVNVGLVAHGADLANTGITARPLAAEHPSRSIALAWRRASPRSKEFELLANVLRDVTGR